jgi:pantoate--beta-alanine ligase
LELEYLEIVDGKTLKRLTDSWVDGAVCCIAAFCGQVRLIDNMQLD